MSNIINSAAKHMLIKTRPRTLTETAEKYQQPSLVYQWLYNEVDQSATPKYAIHAAHIQYGSHPLE